MKRDTIIDIINHIKSNRGCLLCEEDDPAKLQFHHVIPQMKVASVANLVSRRSKLIVVLKEIDKCVCVCTGCHRTLQSHVEFILDNVRAEKWCKDWGVSEALEWAQRHPQDRIVKRNFFEIIKAVIRNSQMQDVEKFTTLPFNKK
ncbi:hypothetical protein KOM00_00025 [Geomonas sp. Red69]|uniref:hypothetical protein n=1 Tax=Geomonas diazotrophica TaxID=2843197 RepID=UPI001C10C8E3|nr:hypothetical protein [Geomonas diazotrophica]MBU5635116.1 hypothetical protein [Geomonas diazotrophica]